MRVRKSTYAVLLFLLVMFGALGMSGVYPKLLLGLSVCCLLLLFAGMFTETSNKIQ